MSQGRNSAASGHGIRGATLYGPSPRVENARFGICDSVCGDLSLDHTIVAEAFKVSRAHCGPLGEGSGGVKGGLVMRSTDSATGSGSAGLPDLGSRG